MKEGFFKKINFIVLTFYCASLVPGLEYAEAFRKTEQIFQSYADRAKIERNEEAWKRIAENGLDTSLSQWEKETLNLRDEDFEIWEKNRSEMKESLLEAKESVFQDWYFTMHEKEKEEIVNSSLYEELIEAKKNFFFDDDGKKTRIVSAEKIQEARRQWLEKAEEIISKYDVDDATFIEKEITNSLMNELLYDHESLRNVSDKEAASVLAEELSLAVEEKTEKSMNAVLNELEMKFENGNMNVDEKEIEDFSEIEKQLNIGLSEWDEAERKFLAERVEWEQNAENVYVKDNEVWASSYQMLKEKKENWVKKINERVQEMKDKFLSRNEIFDSEMEEYFAELENQLYTESTRKTELFEMYSSVYQQSRQILNTAENGISSWFARWSGKFNGVYSYWKTEGEENVLGTITYVKKENVSTVKNQIAVWKRQYLSIISNALESRNKNLKSEISTYEYEIREMKNELVKVNSGVMIGVPWMEAEKIRKEKNEEYGKKITFYESCIESDENEMNRIGGFFSVLGTIDEDTESDDFKSFIASINEGASISSEYSAFFDEENLLWGKEEELEYWLNTIEEYSERSEDAILSMYELTGSTTENQVSDELTNEYLKVSALKEYWESQVSIASYVQSYIENRKSDVDQLSETERKLLEAESSYNEEKNKYGNIINEVMKAKERISGSEEKYVGSLKNLDLILEEIQELRDEYDSVFEEIMSLSKASFVTKGNELVEEINDSIYGRDEMNELLSGYYKSLTDFNSNVFQVSQKTIRNQIINGTEEEGFYCPSIEDLEKMTSLTEGILSENKDIEIVFSESSDFLNLLEKIDEASFGKLKNLYEKSKNQEFDEKYEGLTYRNLLKDILLNVSNQLVSKKLCLQVIDGEKLEFDETKDSENLILKNALWYKSYAKAVFEYLECNEDEDSDLKELDERFKVFQWLTNTEIVEYVNGLESQLSENIFYSDLKEKESKNENLIFENAVYYYDKALNDAGITLSEMKKKALEEYEGFSIDFVNEKNIEASEKINEIISKVLYINEENFELINLTEKMSDEELKEFFSKLEEASDGLSETGLHALKVFEEQVEKSRSESDVSEINKMLTSALGEVIYASEAEYHAYEYSEYFRTYCNDFLIKEIPDSEIEISVTETSSCLEYFVQKINSEYENRISFINELYELYEDFKNADKITKELNERLDDLRKEISLKENEYEEQNEMTSGKSEESFLSEYEKNCDLYNALLKESESCYKDLENERRKYRAAEELYLWAENEYLHDEGFSYGKDYVSNKEKLAESTEKLNYINKQLEILEQLMEEQKENDSFELKTEDEDLLSSYEKSLREYFVSRVMVFEYEEELVKQREELYEKQQNEKEALNRLVKNASSGESFRIPVCAMDFVEISMNEGVYSFDLMENGKAESDKNLWIDYYTSFTEKDEDVYGNIEYSTKAKLDAKKFLESLCEKAYSIEDLALASLYLKMQGNDEEKTKWLLDGEDPSVYENYSMGDIPSETHDVRIREIYNDERLSVIKMAYEKVLGNGGKNDIALYLVYSETNINSSLELFEREKDEIAVRSMEKVKRDLQSRYDYYNGLGIGYSALAAAFAATAALPWHAWALVPMAAALAAAGTMFHAASKISEVRSDVCDVQNGYDSIVQEYNTLQSSYYQQYIDCKNEREKAEKRLNIMEYGTEVPDNSTVTYEELMKALEEVFDSGKTSVDFDYVKKLHVPENDKGNFKQLFDIACKKDSTKITDVIGDVFSYLKDSFEEESAKVFNEAEKRRTRQKELTDEYNEVLVNQMSSENETGDYKNLLTEAFGKDSWNENAFHRTISKIIYENVLKDVPISLNRITENYISDVFDYLKTTFSEDLEYGNERILDERNFYYNLLDMEQYLQEKDFEKQINASINAGNVEWNKAGEKLNASYNQWKKNWEKEYEEKTEEWKENYSNLIADKQKWLNGIYLDGVFESTNAEGKYGFVKDMEEKTEIQNISDFVDSITNSKLIKNVEGFISELSSTEIASVVINKNVSKKESLYRKLDEVSQVQVSLEKEMKKAAAKYSSYVFDEKLKDLLSEYENEILEKNKETESWENNLVRKSGYKTGNEIYRDAVIDSTVFETIRKHQTVHKYVYYDSEVPLLDSSSMNYEYADDSYFNALMNENLKRINLWKEKVFGKEDDGGTKLTEGELEEHIGYAPSFIDDVDLTKSREENIKTPGKGEIGLIMLDFIWNSMENANGYAELNKAMYDQKLFSAENSIIEIPTIRTLSSIVCDIAASATGHEWLRYFDDAVYTTLDYSMNYKSDAEILNYVAHTAGNVLINKLAGSAASSLFKGSENTIRQGSYLKNSLKKGIAGFTGSIGSNYWNNFDVTTGKMDWKNASQIFTKASGYDSLISGSVEGLLGEMNFFDDDGIMFNGAMFGSIASRNEIAGRLASGAINYATGGEISFNLANVYGNGILKVSFGQDGIKAGIGSDGIDLSLGSLLEMADSFYKENKISEMKKNCTQALSLINLLGITDNSSNLKLAEELFESDTVSIEDGKNITEIEKEIKDMLSDPSLSAEERYKSLVVFGAKLAEKYAGKNSSGPGNTGFTSLAASGAVLAAGNKLFDFEYEEETSLEKEVEAAQALEITEGNEEVAFAIIQNQIRKSAEVRDSGDYQNNGDYKNVLLGWGLTKDEKMQVIQSSFSEVYEDIALKDFLMKNNYMEKQTESELHNSNYKNLSALEKLKYMGLSESEIEKFKEETKKLMEKDAKEYTIAGYGCTLATAAYIAYSVSGKYDNLAEVNEKAKEAGVFISNGDEKTPEKNTLQVYGADNSVTTYEKLVNALVGEEVIKYETSRTDPKKIYDQIVTATSQSEKLYYIHMRTYYKKGASISGHSVLFQSMNDTGNYETSTLNVLNPWHVSDGSHATRKLTEISRADFYFLTEKGKEIYNQSRA